MLEPCTATVKSARRPPPSSSRRHRCDRPGDRDVTFAVTSSSSHSRASLPVREIFRQSLRSAKAFAAVRSSRITGGSYVGYGHASAPGSGAGGRYILAQGTKGPNMRGSSETRGDVAKRLLDAWRGEIEARAVYEALAAREKDERRAAVLRRMAAGEAGHLQRIEARMRELGVSVPDPATVKLSPWQRLQIRVAPVERILASREARENEEIASGYGLPTGDSGTDSLFQSIRDDERSHARQLSALTDAMPGGHPPGQGSPRKRLDQILARESWHQRGSGLISGAIYGS